MSRPPRVFLSHAGEDKQRFVVAFAEKLIAKGVDVWLDDWEILPGDRLVEKIFEEGLGQANAILVVLSKHSVKKAWVREELDAAVVKRINEGTRLIPVLIDECEVPEPLRATAWEKIDDLQNYDVNLARIVASIFGEKTKPSIGEPPAYLTQEPRIPKLSSADEFVLRVACEHALRTRELFQDPTQVFSGAEPTLSAQEIEESISVLDQAGLLEMTQTSGREPPPYEITGDGLEAYAVHYLKDYERTIEAVIGAVVNEELRDNRSIAEKVGKEEVLVDHVLDRLELLGYLTLSKMLGGHTEVFEVRPTLRRLLES